MPGRHCAPAAAHPPIRHARRRQPDRTAAGHPARRDAESVFLRDGDEIDIPVRDQLAPRSVGAQEIRHPLQRIDRRALSPHRLMAEENQPRVVADMRMGQEDAVRRPRSGGAGDHVEIMKLLAHVRGGLKQEALPRLVMHHAQRDRAHRQ